MLRPGTDGALACAVMHVLFREGYADRSYMREYTDEPDALERHLSLYADDSAVDEVVDIPGWTEEHVEAMTEAYETDLDRIALMPGITVIRP